nr:MAG TPA: hypothetical protein [Caudoviricetes sp.]
MQMNCYLYYSNRLSMQLSVGCLLLKRENSC